MPDKPGEEKKISRMKAQEHALGENVFSHCPFQLTFWHQKLTVQHDHDFHELVVVLGGSGLHCTEYGRFRIYPGEVFVIRPGELHCYLDMENLYIANLMLDMTRLQVPEGAWNRFEGYTALFDVEPALRREKVYPKHFSLNMENFSGIRARLERLNDELEKKRTGYELVGHWLVVDLLVTLFRCYSESDEPRQYHMLQLVKMLQFMKNNLHRKITLEEIAKSGNLSVRSANRVFQTLLYESPLQHFMTMRMEAAADTLCRTTLPIGYVAMDLGFSDSNHFTAAFRRHFGVSPRQYQNQRQIAPGKGSSAPAGEA